MPRNGKQGWKRRAGKPAKWPRILKNERQELKTQADQLLDRMPPEERREFLLWLGRINLTRTLSKKVKMPPVPKNRSEHQIATAKQEQFVREAGRGMLRKVLRKSLRVSEAAKKRPQ